MKKRRRKATTPKRGIAPKTVRSSSDATHQTEMARVIRERDELLEQRTAISDILRVISNSPSDVQPVLDSVAEHAARICEAQDVDILIVDNEVFRIAASFGELSRLSSGEPVPLDRATVTGRSICDLQPVHVADLQNAGDEFPLGRELAIRHGHRTILSVPLIREGHALGAIMVRRPEVRPFEQKHIALLTTFADQAAIAIENVRLFKAEQQRSRELAESLEQQTATSEVLQVISRSAFDLEAVLNTLVESAARVCEAERGVILRPTREGASYHSAASYGHTPEYDEYIKTLIFTPGRDTLAGRVLLAGKSVQIVDVLADAEWAHAHPGAAKLGNFRTMLGAPLLREGTPIGIFLLQRAEVRPFTEKQIKLVETFADQAVIAIENTRLFESEQQRTHELTESLSQQTATADVLKVISRSTFDLQTVLQTLVESAAKLCDADQATITREKDGAFYRAEAYGFSSEFMDYARDIPIKPERGTASGRALLEGRVIHIPDVKADPEYTWVEAQRLGDFRTILCMPMLREGVPIGILVLARSEVRPFTDKQIELVTTFADQAAIAIENVRLFEAEQQRTRELTKSLEDLRTTQDRLVQTQKLASLGQLTAGIAHEIKNPLNFVNNFSGVSVEMIEELQEALDRMKGDAKTRAAIAELTDTLRDNLNKIVQHGKRADAIVKNMLLHSRQGSGEHRLVDVNALVEESLNLAYHGARAENQGFKINIERLFDPTAGEVDVYPQEITRALLNLISNGIYAATKRKDQSNCEGFEPTLTAATKNLGDKVEISIRDNGTGIPLEVKEKMFNPFFTTKPAGEGTGLGLSITHDIVVKQHSGLIEVDSQPGEYTEVRIVLRRAAGFIAEGRASPN